MQIVRETFTESYWFVLSTIEQLAHIGDDVERAIDFRKNGDVAQCNNAIQKALELLELIMNDSQNMRRLSEISKVKMTLLDDFYGKNEYQSTDAGWIKYFAYFKHLSKQKKEEDNLWHK